MYQTIGFIGGGNMGTAIIGGILSSNLAAPSQLIASDANIKNIHFLKETFHIKAISNNADVAANSDILFLAVKPNIYPKVIEEIRDPLKQETLVISIAAGPSIAYLESLFKKPVKLIRAMPNTPALVRESMSAICPNSQVEGEELKVVQAIFQSFGKVQLVPESLMDTVTGISGSSPAYVYLFIEAMADAAVADGMPRAQAYEFAAQSVMGAAKMVLGTQNHPGELKDMVCSPGGTTIEAVAVLEREGFRNAVITAQRACVKKAKEMGK